MCPVIDLLKYISSNSSLLRGAKKTNRRLILNERDPNFSHFLLEVFQKCGSKFLHKIIFAIFFYTVINIKFS